MKRLLLTISGKDKPGIIAKVTGLLFRAGCNLEDISMTLLEGQFAMMLTACVPGQTSMGTLSRALLVLKDPPWGMTYFASGLKGGATRGKKTFSGSYACVITAFGKDRTGIVYEVSRLLARNRINITDLDSRILGRGKKATYAMLIEAEVPKRVSMARLKTILSRAARKLKIEIRVRAHEPISF